MLDKEDKINTYMADNSLLEKVLGLQEKYEALQNQLADPEVISDMKKFVQLNKEYKELTPIIEAGNEFKRILENYEMAKEILATEKDEDLREMAKEEIAEIEPTLLSGRRRSSCSSSLQILRTARTLSLRSVADQVETRRPSLPVTSSACTLSSSRQEAGGWRSQARPKVLQAVSRKSCARYQETAYMAS